MSDAPRWPGADGAPGLDFSSERTTTGPDSLYRGGESSGAPSFEVTSPGSPSRGIDVEPAMESTVISGPKAKTQSAVEWASRPLGTTAPVPARSATRNTAAASAASGASASGAPLSVGSADPAASPRAPRVGSRRTRKARLRLARIDPWSVMKTTFLFSIAFGVMLIVIVSVLWSVIAASGALEALNQFLTTLVGDQTGGEFRIETYVSGSRVLGFAAVLAAIDVVIITAVSTLFAFLYNLAATIMGGLEVTLAED